MEQTTEPTSTSGAPLEPGRSWFRDRWFSVGFQVWVVTIVLALLPILPAAKRSVFSDLWGDFATLPFTIVLAAWNVRQAESRREGKFWGFFALALCAWLLVRVMYVAWPDESWGVVEDVVTDATYGLFYLLVALALEMKPHTRPTNTPRLRAEPEGIPVLTTIMFFVATVVYFIVLPARQQPEEYRFWMFSFGLYVVLDLYLCGRLLSLSHRVRDQWSNVYRWLRITFVLWAITDAAEGALYADLLPWIEPGSPLEFVWYLPSLTLIIALRSRWWSAPEPVTK
jgi:hypothetical protein